MKLRQPIYLETAAYGHVGRKPVKVDKTFKDANGNVFERTVELFTWEKTDKVDDLKKLFK